MSRSPASAGRVRVLYIAGTGRSGSTLLAGILGEVPGVFDAGELRFLWERGLLENRLCGCGQRFAACPVWAAVLVAAFGGTQAVDARATLAEQRRRTRVRHLPRLLLGARPRSMPDAVGEPLARLYAAVAEVTKSSVIVDSSKLPSYARLLDGIPSVDLRVVHLVRDPRSAAQSWMRRKLQPDRGYPADMQTIGPLKSASLWLLWNAAAELLCRRPGRYLRIRYEDFIDRPRPTVARILALSGVDIGTTPFIDERTVLLGVNHTVAGNPDRLRHGVTRVQAPTAAGTRLRPRHLAAVTAITVPLLLRYGYPLGGAGAPAPAPEARWRNVQRMPRLLRAAHRLERHWRWGRTQGFRRLVEEDQLDPVARLRTAAVRRRWVREHPGVRGSATPVFVVGLQRSGTNMVTRAVEASGAFEVHNENDARAFDRFLLRPDPVIRSLVERSPHRFVLFKPLCDSHRVDRLLDGLGTRSPGRAIWVVRSVDGRTRSALAKFGANNLHVLRDIAEGRGGALWQAQGMSGETLAMLRGRDWSSTSPATACALFWYARNRLFFDLGLDRRDDTMLLSYDAFVRDPQAHLRAMASFLGCEVPVLPPGSIAPRDRRARPPLEVDAEVGALCESLERRLAEAAVAALERHGANPAVAV